jgi:hypothetical protein
MQFDPDFAVRAVVREKAGTVRLLPRGDLSAPSERLIVAAMSSSQLGCRPYCREYPECTAVSGTATSRAGANSPTQRARSRR